LSKKYRKKSGGLSRSKKKKERKESYFQTTKGSFTGVNHKHRYLHMRAKRCFYNLWQYSIIAVNIMQPHLDIAASYLRNRQWVYQSCCSPTQIHEYEEKDLHLHRAKE
jgi:hypothetical protein